MSMKRKLEYLYYFQTKQNSGHRNLVGIKKGITDRDFKMAALLKGW